MLKKQKENSGLLAQGAGQLAEWRDGAAETVTYCLSSLRDGEVKREWRSRKGQRRIDGLWMKLNCKVIGKVGTLPSRKEATSRAQRGEVENSGGVLRGCLFSLCCCWKVEGKWVLERTRLN